MEHGRSRREVAVCSKLVSEKSTREEAGQETYLPTVVFLQAVPSSRIQVEVVTGESVVASDIAVENPKEDDEHEEAD